MGSMSRLDPSALLLAPPQQVNPSIHSLAAAGVSALSLSTQLHPPPQKKKQRKKRKLGNILETEQNLLPGKYVAGKDMKKKRSCCVFSIPSQLLHMSV